MNSQETSTKRMMLDHLQAEDDSKPSFVVSSPRRPACTGHCQEHSRSGSKNKSESSNGTVPEISWNKKCPCSSLSAFQHLALTPKALPSLSKGNFTGKRSRSMFETPSPSGTNIGRATILPVPPPLKPNRQEGVPELVVIEAFVHSFPLLGEDGEEDLRDGGGGDDNEGPKDLAFARRLQMKKSRSDSVSPRSVGNDLNF
jgi:hypothetical protein